MLGRGWLKEKGNHLVLEMATQVILTLGKNNLKKQSDEATKKNLMSGAKNQNLTKEPHNKFQLS